MRARLPGQQLGGKNISCGIMGHAGSFDLANRRFELLFVRGAVVQKPLEFAQFTRVLSERCSVGTPDRIVRCHNYQTALGAKGFAILPVFLVKIRRNQADK